MWEVTVSNIGTVHEGRSEKEASDVWEAYVLDSAAPYGKASGEDVTLWHDGEIVMEHAGSNPTE